MGSDARLQPGRDGEPYPISPSFTEAPGGWKRRRNGSAAGVVIVAVTSTYRPTASIVASEAELNAAASVARRARDLSRGRESGALSRVRANQVAVGEELRGETRTGLRPLRETIGIGSMHDSLPRHPGIPKARVPRGAAGRPVID